MNLLAHAISERGIHELMLTHPGLVAEQRTHDDRFEMATVPGDFDVLAFEPVFDVLLNKCGIQEKPQWRILYPERIRVSASNDKARKLKVTIASDNHGETSAWPKKP